MGTFIHPHWLYNPWSILYCLNQELQLRPYWVNTSSNRLIGEVLLKAGREVKKQLELLLQGDTADVKFEENVVFADLTSQDEAVWGLLVASG